MIVHRGRVVIALMAVLASACDRPAPLTLECDIYHPVFGPTCWVDRSVYLMNHLARSSDLDIKNEDGVICYENIGPSIRPARFIHSRDGSCIYYAPAYIIAVEPDEVGVAVRLNAHSPWLDRESQRYEKGLVKHATVEVQADGDGRLTARRIIRVTTSPGEPIRLK